MKKQEILNRINEIIIDEKGTELVPDGMFLDSNLDSLGITVALMIIDDEFSIFKGMSEEEAFESLDIPNLTTRDLLNKCKSLNIDTSMEQKND